MDIHVATTSIYKPKRSKRKGLLLLQNRIDHKRNKKRNGADIYDYTDKQRSTSFEIKKVGHFEQRSIYGLYIKSAPFFGDLKFFSRDKK